MTITAKQNPNRCPPHPGEVIEDMLEDMDYSKSAIARMLGISRQQLHAILAMRKPVSPETAARLGKLFGNGPGLWLRLQAAHDAWHAEREVDVSAVPSLTLAG
ncbi:HigA family addiction module antidote protein [Pistricoccus aurantiacus]|uniref:HigA family addiction module antidote protein n=1 Tax=Pistricoccus aurantiacus TaxID=1883414 RepID=A0A5B8SUR4_9GAMM|nr:HigA family addiction module antitoxin [Pistricoccus aurantiacus]QEA40071.1 HigA family addiction module antidote protein [Pistricoccus aurantiacus]